MGLQQWGTFEAGGRDVECHRKPEAGDVELLDQAAGYTFAKGGKVYINGLKEVQMKDSVAAVFRY
ncbi:MAG: hypothetical protein U9R48_09860 [Chloroflexota bacterium]|nr:hypothetical protein [Chloroflexota bacterium]